MLDTHRRIVTTLLVLATCLIGTESRAAKKRPLELRLVPLLLPGMPAMIIPTDVDGDGRQDLLMVLAYTEVESIGIDRVEEMVQITTVIPALFDRREVRVYLAQPDGSLQVGPYQGPIACMRLPKGRGVCGKAVESQRSVLVPDVRSYPGHIECNVRSKSEIVVPIRADGRILGVLDVDSDKPNAFTETDRKRLEEIADLLAPLLA